MARQSEQLEREAEEARNRLLGDLDELRLRISPGQVVDQVTDYVREGPMADMLRNLAGEVRENPVPLLLIGIGILWLIIASRNSRAATPVPIGETEFVPMADLDPATIASFEPVPEEREDVLTPVAE
jgi:hypothetical protein